MGKELVAHNQLVEPTEELGRVTLDPPDTKHIQLYTYEDETGQVYKGLIEELERHIPQRPTIYYVRIDQTEPEPATGQVKVERPANNDEAKTIALLGWYALRAENRT